MSKKTNVTKEDVKDTIESQETAIVKAFDDAHDDLSAVADALAASETAPETDKLALAEVKRHQELLECMPEELRKVALKFDRCERIRLKSELLASYAEGECVAQVWPDKPTDKFGPKPVEVLSAYTGVSEQQLGFMRQVVRAFTREEVTAYGERLMADGRTIGFTHLRFIAQECDHPTDRKRLVERVFAEALTVRQLEEIIANRNAVRTAAKGHGRSPAEARTPLAGLQQITAFGERAEHLEQRWEKVVFTPLEKAEMSRLTPLIKEKLEAAVESLNNVITLCKGSCVRIAPLIKKTDASIAAAKKALAKHTAEEKSMSKAPKPSA